eukprot:1862824-Pyramimonas_sp.AAC.1
MPLLKGKGDFVITNKSSDQANPTAPAPPDHPEISPVRCRAGQPSRLQLKNPLNPLLDPLLDPPPDPL